MLAHATYSMSGSMECYHTALDFICKRRKVIYANSIFSKKKYTPPNILSSWHLNMLYIAPVWF